MMNKLLRVLVLISFCGYSSVAVTMMRHRVVAPEPVMVPVNPDYPLGDLRPATAAEIIAAADLIQTQGPAVPNPNVRRELFPEPVEPVQDDEPVQEEQQ